MHARTRSRRAITRFGWECGWSKDCAKTKRQRIVAARTERAFASMADVAQRAELSPTCDARAGDVRRISRLDASIAISLLGCTGRRATAAECRWLTRRAPKNCPRCRAPSEWEEILRDYHQLGFSTGRHPLALLRPRCAHSAFSDAATWSQSAAAVSSASADWSLICSIRRLRRA